MSAASRFVDILEQQGMLEDKVIAGLRKQLQEKGDRVSPDSVAKLLVSKGHLTKFQANKLIEQVGDDPADSVAEAAPAAADDDLGLAPESDELGLAGEEDELGLAPAPGEAAKPAAPSKPTSSKPVEPAPAEDDIVEMEEAVEMEVIDEGPAGGLEPLDGGGLHPFDAGGLEPLDGGGLEPLDSGGLQPLDGGFGGGLEPLDGGLSPIDGGLMPLDGAGGGYGADSGGLSPIDGGGNVAVAGDGGQKTVVKQATAEEAEEIRKRLAEKNKSVWDSKWLLFGGGLLMLLLLAGAALYFSLTRGGEAERFKAAEDDYRAQAYSAAIKKYEDFVESYPNSDDASLARVRISICKLRIAVDQGSDVATMLKTALEELPKIETETAISEARGELAGLLPDIAEKILARAERLQSTGEKQQMLDMLDQTIKLIENPVYITKNLLDAQPKRIAAIREGRARLEREIGRSNALAESLKEIDTAVGKQDPNEAYAARTALLKRYPELESSDPMREATQKITDTQRDLVRVSTESLAAETSDVANRSEFTIVLSSRSGNGAAGLSGRVAYVLVDGAVYGLAANDGKVLWRRYVGRDRVIQPQPISAEPGADALVADVARHELVRVAATTGKLVWRLPIGEPFQTPQIANQQLFVTTDSGRILSVDLESGVSNTQAKLPQVTAASPTFDMRRPYLYQLGDHSNLYVLAKDSLASNEVYYLGHQPGTIAVPPVMALGHLFVAENAGPNYSLLHVLATDANGLKLKEPQEPFRLQGHVLVPPFLAGRRVIVMTDSAALYVFDVEPTTPEKPVTEVLKEIPKTFEKYLTYPFVDGTNLWMAGRSLAYYEMQFANGQLKSNWVDFANETFVATPRQFDTALVLVRRPANGTGYRVSAIHGTEKTPLWETDLSVPAGQICVDPATSTISSVSSHGALYKIDRQALTEGYANPAADLGSLTAMSYTDGVELGGGKWALVDPNNLSRVAFYDTTQSTRPLRAVSTNLPEGKATAGAVAFGDGVIVAMDNGLVAHVDLASGEHAKPFQPSIEPNTKFVWRQPAVIGDGGEFVIANNRLKLYRVGVSTQGAKNLRQLAEADVSAEIVSPLASVGSLVYGVIRGGSGDIVATFKVPDLKPGKEWNLDGRVTWGPQRVGDLVLLISDSEGLICFDGGDEKKWTQPFTHDAIVGSPTVDGDTLLFASVSGEVWRVDAASGQELGATQLGEPLASGPALFNTRVLLSGSDGVLHVIPKPTATATSAATAATGN
ncbi:MAG: PQQ-binding-like beta-propeller repeat protein [Planctomycetales bacterium]|nr:PQQ-binding-like beta-propeller repeat protein [Planctomycetales bacterium]